jgi:hypothetical protein
MRRYPHPVRDLNEFLNTGEAVAGVFHSPGGEDHLGCLCLNRLCLEPSPDLLKFMGQGLPSVLAVHEFLLERERKREDESAEPAMMCTGKSRRLVLQGIGRVCASMGEGGMAHLRQIVGKGAGYIPVTIVTTLQAPQITPQILRRLCDCILDLAEFDAAIISSSWEDIIKIAQVVTWGFDHAASGDEALLEEWARVRTAVHCVYVSVLRGADASAVGGVLESLYSICKAEVGMAQQVLAGGGGRDIFCTAVVQDFLEAGAFVHAAVSVKGSDKTLSQFAGGVGEDVMRMVSSHLNPALLVARIAGDGGGKLRTSSSLEATRGSVEADLGGGFEDPRGGNFEAYAKVSRRVHPQSKRKILTLVLLRLSC